MRYHCHTHMETHAIFIINSDLKLRGLDLNLLKINITI